jgi:hypothetical protein
MTMATARRRPKPRRPKELGAPGGKTLVDYKELSEFNKELAREVRGFLNKLATNDTLLAEYVHNRIAVLQRQRNLSDAAKDLLLDGNYDRVYEVMSSGSAPNQWLVIWIV